MDKIEALKKQFEDILNHGASSAEAQEKIQKIIKQLNNMINVGNENNDTKEALKLKKEIISKTYNAHHLITEVQNHKEGLNDFITALENDRIIQASDLQNFQKQALSTLTKLEDLSQCEVNDKIKNAISDLSQHILQSIIFENLPLDILSNEEKSLALNTSYEKILRPTSSNKTRYQRLKNLLISNFKEICDLSKETFPQQSYDAAQKRCFEICFELKNIITFCDNTSEQEKQRLSQILFVAERLYRKIIEMQKQITRSNDKKNQLRQTETYENALLKTHQEQYEKYEHAIDMVENAYNHADKYGYYNDLYYKFHEIIDTLSEEIKAGIANPNTQRKLEKIIADSEAALKKVKANKNKLDHLESSEKTFITAPKDIRNNKLYSHFSNLLEETDAFCKKLNKTSSIKNCNNAYCRYTNFISQASKELELSSTSTEDKERLELLISHAKKKRRKFLDLKKDLLQKEKNDLSTEEEPQDDNVEVTESTSDSSDTQNSIAAQDIESNTEIDQAGQNIQHPFEQTQRGFEDPNEKPYIQPDQDKPQKMSNIEVETRPALPGEEIPTEPLDEDTYYIEKYIFTLIQPAEKQQPPSPPTKTHDVEFNLLDDNITDPILLDAPIIPEASTIGGAFLTPIRAHINPQQTLAKFNKLSQIIRLELIAPKPILTGHHQNIFFKKTYLPSLSPKLVKLLSPKNAPLSSNCNATTTKQKGFRANGGKAFLYMMAFDIGTQSLERRIYNLGGDGSYIPTIKNIDIFFDNITRQYDELGGLNPGGHYMPTNEIYNMSSTGVKSFFETTNYILLCVNDSMYHTVNFAFPEKPLQKEHYPIRALNKVMSTTIECLGGDLAKQRSEINAAFSTNPIISIEMRLAAIMSPKFKILYAQKLRKEKLQYKTIHCLAKSEQNSLLIDKGRNIPSLKFNNQ